jgi:hypothetical protein
MSNQNKFLNNLILFSTALAIPYAYYIFIRPRLLNLEKRFDDKMTDIKEDEFQKMKKKMENLKDK